MRNIVIFWDSPVSKNVGHAVGCDGSGDVPHATVSGVIQLKRPRQTGIVLPWAHGIVVQFRNRIFEVVKLAAKMGLHLRATPTPHLHGPCIVQAMQGLLHFTAVGGDLVTATQIIIGALTDIGIFGSWGTASVDDLNYSLTRLQGIVDSWSTERLSLYAVAHAILALIANQQDYTFGPSGADFTTIGRPVLIQTMSIVLAGTTIRFPMNMLTAKQWAMIPEKGLTGVLPTDVYLDQQYPNTGIHLAPIPNAIQGLEVFYCAAHSQFPDLVTDVGFPPGYMDALKYTLMLHLSPAYNKPIDPAILALAQSKKAAIQTINAQILSGSFGETRTLHGPNIGAAIEPPIMTPGGQGGEPGPVTF